MKIVVTKDITNTTAIKGIIGFPVMNFVKCPNAVRLYPTDILNGFFFQEIEFIPIEVIITIKTKKTAAKMLIMVGESSEAGNRYNGLVSCTAEMKRPRKDNRKNINLRI